MVITGTRTEKVISEAPVMTRVVSAEELQRNDYESMMDVLEYNIPGSVLTWTLAVIISRFRDWKIVTSLSWLMGRGYLRLRGPIDFDRLSTSNIKRIEILKGAASALYGQVPWVWL
ncbi:MAG: TonB-dependent receptor plug domain-containing protein [Butyricimonas paravirosa]